VLTPDNLLQFIFQTGVSGDGAMQLAEYNGSVIVQALLLEPLALILSKLPLLESSWTLSMRTMDDGLINQESQVVDSSGQIHAIISYVPGEYYYTQCFSTLSDS